MSTNNKKKILLMTDWYEPGYKAGGPIRSCVNFAEHMNDTYSLYVFTRDRDLGEDKPYDNIETDKWLKCGESKVFYASPAFLRWGTILQQIVLIQPDYLYVNSMFSTSFTVYPLLMKRLGKINSQIILAPRGMLKDSAMHFKTRKKKVFLRLIKLLRIPGLIHFHATDKREANDIKKQFGDETTVSLISNFPGVQKTYNALLNKEPGALSMIFVGRVHPIKNLHFLLKSLHGVRALVKLTIVGTVEDAGYWESCRQLIDRLPSNIKVTLINDVPHHTLEKLLQQSHLFALPTQGENFGHAIFESLAAGRPVLISDQTPWRNLPSHQAGWDLPLNDGGAFTAVIERAAMMRNEEFQGWCKGAWQFCNDFIHYSNIKQQYLKLFN